MAKVVELKHINAFLRSGTPEPEHLKSDIINLRSFAFQLQKKIKEIKRELELEQEEKAQLLQLSRLDPETQLPISRFFRADLNSLVDKRRRQFESGEFEEVKAFAVVHIRLDENFEQITPERYKKILAFKIANQLRQIEMFDGHLYQGDSLGDFHLLLPMLRDEDTVRNIFDLEVFPMFREYHSTEDLRIKFDAHVGVAIFPEAGDNTYTLFESLELATDNSIRFNSRMTVYNAELGKEYRYRMRIRRELKLARQGYYQDFQLGYQPFVNRQGKIIGCETLVRWHHPDLGFISPGLFIGLAEKHGEMNPLGWWILYRACEQMKAWLDAGAEIEYVSVNLSPLQFEETFARDIHGEDLDLGLEQSIHSLLETMGLRGDQLKLEITEGAIMKDPLHSIDKLHRLRESDIRIAVDDFGTGYSSLNYLIKLPINTLKIDKSFVDDMMTNESNRVVVKSIIDLGKNLNLEILVEGVENKDQKEFLFEHGVDLIQGYYYAPAVSGEEFSRLLAENTFSDR
jgi:EAL domain-containing protein (putative c-di-GMP-specific phosphodiesterase class I)